MLAVTAHDHVPPGPVAVLANPSAGRGRHRGLLPRILERLAAAGRPVELLRARTPAEAEAACHAAVADGAGALVTVGGDGTVHRALQAVAGTAVPFGPVPAGTGNDFAVETGFPADPAAAVEVIADALAAGRTRPVDLARLSRPGVPDRWYGAVLAAGFDAIVNERANRMRWPRGPRRYDLAIVVELAKLRPRRYRLVTGRGAAGGGRGADRGRQRGQLRRWHADLPGRRPARRPAGRGGRRPVRQAHADAGQAADLPGHARHASAGARYRARTVELATDGITTYADGERSLDLPVTVTAAPAALRLLR